MEVASENSTLQIWEHSTSVLSSQLTNCRSQPNTCNKVAWSGSKSTTTREQRHKHFLWNLQSASRCEVLGSSSSQTGQDTANFGRAKFQTVEDRRKVDKNTSRSAQTSGTSEHHVRIQGVWCAHCRHLKKMDKIILDMCEQRRHPSNRIKTS